MTDEKIVEGYLQDAPANVRNNAYAAFNHVLAQTGSYKAAHEAADALERILKNS